MGNDPNNSGMTIHTETVLRGPNGSGAQQPWPTVGNGGTDVVIHTYTDGSTLRVTNSGLVGRTNGEGWIGNTEQLSAYSA